MTLYGLHVKLSPGRKPQLLTQRLRYDHPSCRINGSSHGITIPFGCHASGTKLNQDAPGTGLRERNKARTRRSPEVATLHGIARSPLSRAEVCRAGSFSGWSRVPGSATVEAAITDS
jgi:hypothetical protein